MRWNNATSYATADLTAEQAQSLSLPPITGTLHVYARHSGVDDPAIITNDPGTSTPPEYDIEIHDITSAVYLDASCSEIVLNREQIDVILDGGEVFEMICNKILNGSN